MKTQIRWMTRRDMYEVLDIEKSSFEFPWCENTFIHCLRQRNCIGMVFEYDEKILGFVIYELFKTHLHILNFAVHPDFRRLEFGKQMIRKLIGKLSPRRTRILAEVRETNLGAQLFFKNCGFRATSVLRNWYEEISEDAYLMEYVVSTPCDISSRITDDIWKEGAK